MSTIRTETETLATTRGNPDLPRVLLVEDEQAIRDIIVPWLFADGFDCREAADGRAAMDLLASGIRINLVLSNMLLPARWTVRASYSRQAALSSHPLRFRHSRT